MGRGWFHESFTWVGRSAKFLPIPITPGYPIRYEIVLRLFRALNLVAVVGLTACLSENAPPTDTWALEAIDVPAGEGSRWSQLSSTVDGSILSWLEPAGPDGWALSASVFDGSSWSPPSEVARSGDQDFFVNWADFPSVRVLPDGTWSAHWLVRGPEGGYDYGVRFAQSRDGGRSWSDPLIPHEDGTPTEHGFVTIFPMPDGGAGMVWLDGRKFASAAAVEDHAAAEMTLRFRSVGPDGTPGPEMEVDGRTCDCCQTDAAITSRGPVVVYRDRTHEEVRDIYITRLVDGAWTEGQPVHDDGWVFGACPVNGPAVAARGETVVVAWFSAGQGTPRVQVAYSSDAGVSFGPPVRLDEGNPLGRTDVLLLEDGSALVSWLEASGQTGSIMARRVGGDGTLGPVRNVRENSPGRDSGFPRMSQDAEGRVLFTWTLAGDGGRVQMARTTSPVGQDG